MKATVLHLELDAKTPIKALAKEIPQGKHLRWVRRPIKA